MIFEGFVNIVDIWLLKYFIKLLGIKLCILIYLTCELLIWICPCAMILALQKTKAIAAFEKRDYKH